MLHHRLRRLERPYTLTESDGFPPCAQCENGASKQVVFRFQGQEPFPPLPTCAGCGRDIAFLFNFRHAEAPGRHEDAATTPNDRPSLSPRTCAHDGASRDDTWPHL